MYSDNIRSFIYERKAVYNHWTGLVEWTTALILEFNFTLCQVFWACLCNYDIFGAFTLYTVCNSHILISVLSICFIIHIVMCAVFLLAA